MQVPASHKVLQAARVGVCHDQHPPTSKAGEHVTPRVSAPDTENDLV